MGRDIIREIAKRHGVSPEEVRAELVRRSPLKTPRPASCGEKLLPMGRNPRRRNLFPVSLIWRSGKMSVNSGTVQESVGKNGKNSLRGGTEKASVVH